MDNIFKIKNSHSGIIIEKDKTRMIIEKSVDNDIWFYSTDNNELQLNFYSDEEELKTYFIFEDLIKSIIGKYFLKGYDKTNYSFLPEDFIDIENKTILWHSDNAEDSTLKIQYKDTRITASITKEKDNKTNSGIKVRIRTNGSSYDTFYQEFEKFYDELNTLVEKIETKEQEKPKRIRKLSFFKQKNDVK